MTEIQQVRNLTYFTAALSFANYATTPISNATFTLASNLEIDSAYPTELVGVNVVVKAYLNGSAIRYKVLNEYVSAELTGDFFSNSKFGLQQSGGVGTIQSNKSVLSFQDGLNLQLPIGFGSLDSVDVHVSPLGLLVSTPFVASDTFRMLIDVSIFYKGIIYSNEG